jgi:hypothetical protein
MHTKIRFFLGAVTFGFALMFFATDSLRADQIVAVVNDHGHKVFINTGDTPSRADWLKPGSHLKGMGFAPPPEINQFVQQTADRHQVDPKLVHAIIQVESAYNSKAVSRKGAQGLMQLIPATARRFGVADPFDPKQNIEGGVNYLRYLLDSFGGNLALSLAAYNAGENSVARYKGVPAFAETRAYIRKVTKLYNSGSPVLSSRPSEKEPAEAPIMRYIDAQGVLHFSNVQ